MSLLIKVFWSFRSPYSYILMPRLVKLVEEYDVNVEMKIVHPAAIRNPAYFATMNSLARPYFLKDSARVAAFHNLRFRRPIPDPINQDPSTLAIAPEQPFALRLGRLGIAAAERGLALRFCDEVSQLLWNGEVTDWHQGDHLANVSARAGLNLSEMEVAIARAPENFDAQLAANDQALRAAGHWGVPTMVFENEAFFGQDRFDMLLWQLMKRGLQSKARNLDRLPRI